MTTALLVWLALSFVALAAFQILLRNNARR